MGSFDITYDADDDFLEVTFAIFDENTSRTVPLSDHVFLFADLSLQNLWGLSIYSYARLLEVSETELTGLRGLPQPQVDAVFALLSRPPASFFFDVTDPNGLIARVSAPSIHPLIRGESG